jgi:hypothetical protein
MGTSRSIYDAKHHQINASDSWLGAAEFLNVVAVELQLREVQCSCACALLTVLAKMLD